MKTNFAPKILFNEIKRQLLLQNLYVILVLLKKTYNVFRNSYLTCRRFQKLWVQTFVVNRTGRKQYVSQKGVQKYTNICMCKKECTIHIKIHAIYGYSKGYVTWYLRHIEVSRQQNFYNISGNKLQQLLHHVGKQTTMTPTYCGMVATSKICFMQNCLLCSKLH